MPASLLYHTNQIENIQVKKVDYSLKGIIYHALYRPPEIVCSRCGSQDCCSKGVKVRKLRMAPLGNKESFLWVELHRLKCMDCNTVWWPTMPFVQSKKRVTISFEHYVLELMKFSTIKHVASFLKVSWSLVKNIHKTHLQREYKEPDFKSLRYIGVDEFSIRKGHEYMTIFINLETGAIIHAVEGRSIDSVRVFMLRLKHQAINLRAIAMDMNAPYAAATREYLVGVDIVYDRFHVMGLLSKAIEEIRREQQDKCNQVGLKALKGCRFLLLSNYEKLNPKKQESLSCLLEINKPLALAHAMKEQLRLFWSKSTPQEGAGFLCWWIMDAIDSGISELAKTGRSLLRRGEDLLNYFKHRITNGKTEGINNKIKTMKRQAYGFRDMDYFKLRLYSLHKTRYSFA